MSVKTLCDECGQPVPATYVHVEEAGIVFSHPGHKVIPEDGLDFCNVTCLAAWAVLHNTKSGDHHHDELPLDEHIRNGL